jgi:hypothetical protein
MNKYLIEKHYLGQAIIVEKYNGEKLSGGIARFNPMPITKATHLLFLENSNHLEYAQKPNDKLLTRIDFNDIKSIDYQIKKVL